MYFVYCCVFSSIINAASLRDWSSPWHKSCFAQFDSCSIYPDDLPFFKPGQNYNSQKIPTSTYISAYIQATSMRLRKPQYFFCSYFSKFSGQTFFLYCSMDQVIHRNTGAKLAHICISPSNADSLVTNFSTHLIRSILPWSKPLVLMYHMIKRKGRDVGFRAAWTSSDMNSFVLSKKPSTVSQSHTLAVKSGSSSFMLKQSIYLSFQEAGYVPQGNQHAEASCQLCGRCMCVCIHMYLKASALHWHLWKGQLLLPITVTANSSWTAHFSLLL